MTDSQISVIGSGDVTEEVYQQAYQVGLGLGDAGVTMVCGGGYGVMEAASRGIRDAEDGLAVGIRPGEDDRGANDYLDVVVPTGFGQARNVAVVLSGRAVIAVDGGYGTLSELAFAQKFGKPIFGVGTWEHERFEFESGLSPDEAVEQALATLG